MKHEAIDSKTTGLNGSPSKAGRPQLVSLGNRNTVDAGINAKQQLSQLNLKNSVVEVESKSLIQKAHELYNNGHQNQKNGAGGYRTPEKPQGLSLADRAARLQYEMNSNDLPAIEEAADKENDTFAQGGPIAALKHSGERREAARLRRERENTSGGRVISNDRSGLRSAEPSSAKKDLYRMYRDPNERNSIGIGQLARKDGIPSRKSYGLKPESQTPGQAPSKASDLISNMKDKVSLPRIQSSRSNQIEQPPSIISRQLSR